MNDNDGTTSHKASLERKLAEHEAFMKEVKSYPDWVRRGTGVDELLESGRDQLVSRLQEGG
jgi:hypothetical protein